MKYITLILLLTASMCSKKHVEELEKSGPNYYVEFIYNGKYYGFNDETHFVSTDYRTHEEKDEIFRYSELSFYSGDPLRDAPDIQLVVVSRFNQDVDLFGECSGPVQSTLDPYLPDGGFYIAPFLHSEKWGARFEVDGEQWADLVFISIGEAYEYNSHTCVDAEIEFNVFANAPPEAAADDVYINLFTEGRAKMQICQ